MPHKISPLTLAIVAGAFGIGGVVAGQVFGLLSGWIDRRHQKRLRKIRRLEKIVELSTEIVSWIQKLGDVRTLDDFRAAKPPLLLRDIVLLARLSFPDLVAPALDYEAVCRDYHQLAWECFDKSLDASLAAQIGAALVTRPDIATRDAAIQSRRRRFDDALVAESARLKDL
jgi:hypothetical protein